MKPQELFAKAIQVATSCIKHVRQDALDNRTPCNEWDLKALLNHMVNELLWMPELLRGNTVADVGDKFDGDVLRSDFRVSWQHAADAALVAAKAADMKGLVHLSYGDVSAEHYVKEISSDILIHTWDMAQSIACTLYFDDQLVKVVYEFLAPRKEELSSSGLFDTAIEVADDATSQDKLLGLTGRSADKWRIDTPT